MAGVKRKNIKLKKKVRPTGKKPGKKPVRKILKKPQKKISKKQQNFSQKGKEKVIGVVTHYFPKVRAAAIKLKTVLAAGDVIKIKGYTTDFSQKVVSLQIDRVFVNSAKKGSEVGLLVDFRVRRGDKVYKE